MVLQAQSIRLDVCAIALTRTAKLRAEILYEKFYTARIVR